MNAQFKFEIGDTVKCDLFHKHPDWVWEGQVVSRANVDVAYSYNGRTYSGNEYEVTNAPQLAERSFPLMAWEEEMSKV